MQIQVISCSKPEWKEKPPKAKWQEVNLTYAAAGKTQVKKFLSFNPIFNKIKEMEEGEQYEVTMTKNDAGYWDWVTVEKNNGEQSVSAPDAPKQLTRPSTYETAEERAQKQIYIIRQSSLSNSIEYSKSVKALKSKEEMFALAEEMVGFVFNTKSGVEALIDMEDDVPA